MTKQIDAELYSIVVFGTDDNSFNVTASLLVKNGHASLINSGFTRSTAHKIIDYIRDNGLALDEVMIIHGDPDYYFGLEQIIRAFPNVMAYSTEETTTHIAETVLNKFKFWREQLKNEAPDNVIIPKIITGSKYNTLGESFEFASTDKTRVNLWDANNRVLIGGIDVFNEIHLFLADTGTREKLESWLDRLNWLKTLNAKIVIPSHGTLKGSFDAKTIDSTEDYLRSTLTAFKGAKDSNILRDALLKHFPNYVNAGVVELGAKVLTKEIAWN